MIIGGKMQNNYWLFDSRNLTEKVASKSVDIVITSPPYWNLKDYDHENQIGFGQPKDEYLHDLDLVLLNCYSSVKSTGSMWLIIDTYSKDNELIMLPWEVAERAKKIGWFLRDIIVWDKQHSLPFQYKGRTRDVAEFILFFTKTDDYKFYLEKIKTTDEISKWWIDFPERFNPKGKTATNIWAFPIRTGGTWPTPSMINHHCPFPTKLIHRILEVASDEGDTVMDPFAGSGIVLATAKAMKRKYIGFDINPAYKKIFDNAVTKTVPREVRQIIEWQKKYHSIPESFFETNIMKLRSLKHTRLSTVNLNDPEIRSQCVGLVNVTNVPKSYDQYRKIKSVVYVVVKKKSEKLKKELIKSLDRSNNSPLSHFHVEATYKLVTKKELLSKSLKIFNKIFYLYPNKKTRAFTKSLKLKEIFSEGDNTLKILPVYSNIKVDLEWLVD